MAFNQEHKKHYKIYNKQFTTSPLLVMSGFNNEDDPAYKIVTFMIQSLFPPLNVEKINLDECR